MIEAGPTHVHPALGPFVPPAAAQFADDQPRPAPRAGDRERPGRAGGSGRPTAARTGRRWWCAAAGQAARRRHRASGRRVPVTSRRPARARASGGAGLLAGLAGEPARPAAAPAALLPAGLAWAAARLGRAGPSRGRAAAGPRRPRRPRRLPGARRAAAAAAASLAIEPRARAICAACSGRRPRRRAPASRGRSTTCCPCPTPRATWSRGCCRAGRAGTPAAQAPDRAGGLPGPLGGRSLRPGRRKDRADAFARAWRRWLGPSELIFTHRTEAGRAALASAGAQSAEYETSTRHIWV